MSDSTSFSIDPPSRSPDPAVVETIRAFLMDDEPSPENAPKGARYDIREQLAQGTFAVVYRVVPADGGSELVLRSFQGQPEAPASYQNRMRQRFRWGLQHHKSVSAIDGVVKLREIIDHAERPGAILDFVNGVPFRDLRGTIGERVHVVRRLAETVRKVHESGVVHRDLKPDNVMVTSDLRPILLDFDLAAKCEGPQPTSWDPTETPIRPGSNYHHPEFREAFDRSQSDLRFNGHNIRQPGVDVYGLGGLLLLALTGRDPDAEFAQTERAVLRASHHALILEAGPGTANLLLNIALRCLAPKLRDTPTVSELIDALEGVARATFGRSARHVLMRCTFGAPLRSITDLQREYTDPVLHGLRRRRAVKRVTCFLALLGPAVLWYVTGTPPIVRLSLALVADLVYFVTATLLLQVVNEVGPIESSTGSRRVVDTSVRVMHHLNHVSWLVSFSVLLATIVALPWEFAWRESKDLRPIWSAGATGENAAGASQEHRVLALWDLRDREKNLYTTTFLDPSGGVVGTCDAIIVGTSVSTWEVVLQKQKQVVPDIIYIDEVEQYPPDLTHHPTRKIDIETTSFYLRGFDNPGSVKLVVPPAPADGLPYVHDYVALGGYGPFVFAREELGQYSGGAAGWSIARFHVFDLGAPESSITMYTGSSIGDGAPSRRESFLTAKEFEALVGLRVGLKDPTDDTGGPFSPGSLGELVGYFPTYREGKPLWTAQFMWPSDRGSGDGEWDTYSRSRFVEVPDLAPEALNSVGAPPASTSHAELPSPRGWSWIRVFDASTLTRRGDCRLAE